LKPPGLAFRASAIQRIIAASTLALCLSVAAPFENSEAQVPGNTQATAGNLKQLSLEQLGDLRVTTTSKEPEEVWRTAAAIYVLTQEDIRRSGATSVPVWCRELKWRASIPAAGLSEYVDSEVAFQNPYLS